MNVYVMPSIVLALGIVSFGLWWHVYSKEARDPDLKPPSMWVVTGVHGLLMVLGFFVPLVLKFQFRPNFADWVVNEWVAGGTLSVSVLVLIAALFMAGFRAMRK